MKIRWIHDLEGLAGLREPWNELVGQSDLDHAFMRHEWFDAWVRNLGDPAALAVATAWADGQLVAAAPLQIRRARKRGVPVREMSFLSSGVSPRCTFLVREAADAAGLFESLLDTRAWDLVVLRNLPLDARASSLFLEAVGEVARGRFFRAPGRRSPYLETAGDFETYWASRSGSVRQTLRTAYNRMKKADHHHEVARIEDGAAFAGMYQELLDTSSRSWKAAVGADIASQEALRRFYLDFSRVGEGLYEAWAFRIDGKVVGFDYHLRGARALSLIRTDFDPEYQRLSPGHCLRADVLRDLFAREGTWEYDMGGQPYGYKLRWVDRIREHVDVVAATRSLTGRAVLRLWSASKRLEEMRRRRRGEDGPASAVRT